MEREILDIERNAAFVMNPARIIELWLAIHGGDPAPDEAVARQTGEILASLAFYNMASTIKDTTAPRRFAGLPESSCSSRSISYRATNPIAAPRWTSLLDTDQVRGAIGRRGAVQR